MPSKTSKRSQNPPSPWKDAPSSSELGVTALARALAAELQAGHRVFLEGPMGAGKTFFARALLSALGVRQPPEGSPSFAIAHEYDSRRGEVVHMDLYRIKAEAELEEAGILAYFWERELIAITEWLSNWPELLARIQATGVCWKVELQFDPADESRRDVRIFRLTPS